MTWILHSDTSAWVISVIISIASNTFTTVPKSTEQVILFNYNFNFFFNSNLYLGLNYRSNHVIKEIIWTQSVSPVINDTVTVILFVSDDFDSVPRNQRMRVLYTICCPNNCLIWIRAQSVNNSCVNEVTNIFYFNRSINPSRNKRSWVKSCQISSAWGDMNTWISCDKIVTIINQLFWNNFPLSLDPIYV